MQNDRHVNEQYPQPDEGLSGHSQILVEGDVTADGAIGSLEAGIEDGKDSGVIFDEPGTNGIVSPMAVIDAVAAEDEAFAETVDEADTTGDGVPDTDLETVYDHLYDVAPKEAAQVIERTDGEYRSLLASVPVEERETFDQRALDMQSAAATVEDATDDEVALTATAVGPATINQAVVSEFADGILRTLVLALAAILFGLMIAYRLAEGSATLGAVTVVPIALVTGLVIGGMFLLEIPLTLLTALLMSLVIGIGIDYNIHISDRFIQELNRTNDVYDALENAVVGTGGALLGSTLTTAGAFATMLLHPHPQLESFGSLVVLALLASFLVSVFVLPSMLLVWARYASDAAGENEATAGSPTPQE